LRSYRDIQDPSTERRERLERVKAILSSGAKTIRRVFYMLGGSASYSSVVKDCVWLRLRGEVGWEAVLEEGRRLLGSESYRNLAEFIGSMPYGYRLSKREAFSNYIEVWLEKATLERLFYRITDKYDVGLLVTRGQISWTALKEASERLPDDSVVLYFGDNDYYGRRIYDSIQGFLSRLGCYPAFERPALTDEQEARFRFPVGEHHLDGMPEDELQRILESSIQQYLDEEKFRELCDREKRDLAKLQRILEQSAENQHEIPRQNRG